MRNKDTEALPVARLEPRLGSYLLAPTVTEERRKRDSVNQHLREGLEMKIRQLRIGRFRI